MPEPDDEDEEAFELQVAMPESVRPGVWANFAQVSHSPYEFTIDFARLEFGSNPPGGVAVARVSMSPLLIDQLISALQDNYRKWAARAMPPEVRGE